MTFKKGAKASIVATLGPSSSNPETFSRMLEKGLDVVRLNMSHGTYDDHKKRFEMVRDIDDTVPILFDLSGPKIRIGTLEKPIVLNTDDQIRIVKKDIVGSKDVVSINYPELIDLAKTGSILFLNDGLIELEVVDKNDEELICQINAGGPLSSRKGLNAPGIPIRLFAPTEKDIKDIENTVDLEPDYYCVSFVRRIADLQKVRDTIAQHISSEIPLISKIEHQDALDNIDDIIKASDALMVARGDLGVELPPEQIPLIQQQLVTKCNIHAKPSIVATQMLESMVLSPKPTRAEASDVANAILQGADAVMLSAETATGHYPIQAVEMMDKLISTVQHKVPERARMMDTGQSNLGESIGKAAVSLAATLNADVILAFTRSGTSSRAVSKFRPLQPIIAITPLATTARRIKLQWGVYPLLLDRDFVDTDEMIYQGINKAYSEGFVKKEHKAVIVAGSLLGLPASINLIHYLHIKEIVDAADARKRFASAYSIAKNS